MFIKLILFIFINVFIFALPVGSTSSNLTIKATSKVKIKIRDEALSGIFTTYLLDFGTHIIEQNNARKTFIGKIKSLNTIKITIIGLGEKNSKVSIPKEVILISERGFVSTVKFSPSLSGDITGSVEERDSILYSLKKKKKLDLVLDGELHDLSGLEAGQYKGMMTMKLITN